MLTGARSAAARDESISQLANSFMAAEVMPLVLQQMKAADIAPRLRTYAPLVRALSEARDLPGVQGLFADMASRGISPQQQEYAALLRALGRAGSAPSAACAPPVSAASRRASSSSAL